MSVSDVVPDEQPAFKNTSHGLPARKDTPHDQLACNHALHDQSVWGNSEPLDSDANPDEQSPSKARPDDSLASGMSHDDLLEQPKLGKLQDDTADVLQPLHVSLDSPSTATSSRLSLRTAKAGRPPLALGATTRTGPKPIAAQPSKKTSLLRFFTVREPSKKALDDYADALRKHKRKDSNYAARPSIATLAMVPAAQLPAHVPPVNSKWDGVSPHMIDPASAKTTHEHAWQFRKRRSTVSSTRTTGFTPAFAHQSPSASTLTFGSSISPIVGSVPSVPSPVRSAGTCPSDTTSSYFWSNSSLHIPRKTRPVSASTAASTLLSSSGPPLPFPLPIEPQAELPNLQPLTSQQEQMPSLLLDDPSLFLPLEPTTPPKAASECSTPRTQASSTSSSQHQSQELPSVPLQTAILNTNGPGILGPPATSPTSSNDARARSRSNAAASALSSSGQERRLTQGAAEGLPLRSSLSLHRRRERSAASQMSQASSTPSRTRSERKSQVKRQMSGHASRRATNAKAPSPSRFVDQDRNDYTSESVGGDGGKTVHAVIQVSHVEKSEAAAGKTKKGHSKEKGRKRWTLLGRN